MKGPGASAPDERQALEHGGSLNLRACVLEYERGLIAKALVEAAGNQRRAAHLLGILPTTLHEKLKRMRSRHPLPSDPAEEGAEASA